jgi:hypothetical protein
MRCRILISYSVSAESRDDGVKYSELFDNGVRYSEPFDDVVGFACSCLRLNVVVIVRELDHAGERHTFFGVAPSHVDFWDQKVDATQGWRSMYSNGLPSSRYPISGGVDLFEKAEAVCVLSTRTVESDCVSSYLGPQPDVEHIFRPVA